VIDSRAVVMIGRFVGMVLLALACTPSDGKDARQGAVPPSADSLVLERSACYGTCPAYRLRLSDSGEIRFQSRNSEDEARRVTDTVAASTFPALISRARSIGFFDLPSKIADDSVLCHKMATDHATVVVTISTKAQTKRVEDYHGCFETVEHEVLPPIARLRSFEVEIDSVLRSSRWVRPADRR
jgi:hypothetical protein